MKTILALLLLAASAGAAPLTIEWDANPAVDAVTQYHVYEKTGETWKLLTSAPAAATEATLALENRPYVLAITAWNVMGESGKSNLLTLPALPNAPGGLRIKVIVTVEMPAP